MIKQRQPTIKVWDLVVRVFHWSLVATFVVAWLSGDDFENLHEIAGYAILGLVAIRLLWGVVGSHYARFTQFVPNPGSVTFYLKEILKRRERRYLGHNPAGGAMVVALLFAIIITGGSGWMMSLDMFWGTEWVEELHETMADLLLVLVGLHVAGVVFTGFRHGENLVRAMTNGCKRQAAAEDIT